MLWVLQDNEFFFGAQDLPLSTALWAAVDHQTPTDNGHFLKDHLRVKFYPSSPHQ